MNEKCFICREIAGESPTKTLESEEGAISVHIACLASFKTLLREVVGGGERIAMSIATSKFVKKLDGKPVLVRRVWPNLSIPILAYLDYEGGPVEPPVIYAWLDESEVKISNPSHYVAQLIKKGYIGVARKDDARLIFITDAGRSYLAETAEEKSPARLDGAEVSK